MKKHIAILLILCCICNVSAQKQITLSENVIVQVGIKAPYIFADSYDYSWQIGNIEPSYRIPFLDSLQSKVYRGSINIYHDKECLNPFSEEEINNIRYKHDTVLIEDPETFELIEMVVISEVGFNSAVAIQFFEQWQYNTESLVLSRNIISYGILNLVYDAENEYSGSLKDGQQPLFWIKNTPKTASNQMKLISPNIFYQVILSGLNPEEIPLEASYSATINTPDQSAVETYALSILQIIFDKPWSQSDLENNNDFPFSLKNALLEFNQKYGNKSNVAQRKEAANAYLQEHLPGMFGFSDEWYVDSNNMSIVRKSIKATINLSDFNPDGERMGFCPLVLP